MKRTLAVLALLAVASPAGAQDMGNAPFAGGGGAGGMPNPRMMSGQARPQEGDPAGRITVRAVQGQFKIDDLGNRVVDQPIGATIQLVAYAADGTVSLISKPVAEDGRAVFDGLATDGSSVYRVMAIYSRPGGEDRLISQPITLPPQVGIRLMLAGEGKDATVAGVDDLVKQEDFSEGPVPGAGEVVVRVRGQAVSGGEVELHAAGTSGAALRAPLEDSATVLNARASAAAPSPDAALRDGLVQVSVKRTGSGIGPIEGATVTVSKDGAAADAAPAAVGPTGADGMANLEGLEAGVRYIAHIAVKGATVDSQPFELPAKGGARINVTATWDEFSALEGHFHEVAPGGDKVYYATVKSGGRTYLSSPFQLSKDKGVATSIFVYPDLVFSFHGGAEVDDQKLWIQMQISVINPTSSPRSVPASGLPIPLPRGFVGASVENVMSQRVKVDPQGLVWHGAVPPGQKDFVASFALDIEDGRVGIELPLPYGAWQSQLVFEDMKGMQLDVPSSAKRQKVNGQNGRPFIVLSDINIQPGRSLAMSVAGLPQPAAWLAWGRRIASVAVLAFIGWVLFGIFGRRSAEAVDSTAVQREKLYTELVTLEVEHRDGRLDEGKYQKSRSRITRRLAELVDERDRGAGPAPSGKA